MWLLKQLCVRRRVDRYCLRENVESLSFSLLAGIATNDISILRKIPFIFSNMYNFTALCITIWSMMSTIIFSFQN